MCVCGGVCGGVWGVCVCVCFHVFSGFFLNKFCLLMA